MTKAMLAADSVRSISGSSLREKLFCRLQRAGPARSNASETMRADSGGESGWTARHRRIQSRELHGRDLHAPRLYRVSAGNNTDQRRRAHTRIWRRSSPSSKSSKLCVLPIARRSLLSRLRSGLLFDLLQFSKDAGVVKSLFGEKFASPSVQAAGTAARNRQRSSYYIAAPRIAW